MIRKKTAPPPSTNAGSKASTEAPCQWLSVYGARQHNLRGIDVSFPLGAFSVVTGVSGSGKSSLVNDILYNTLARTLHRAQTTPGGYDRMVGIEHLNKVIRVDQQPIGQTPTSNPATYTGVFDSIRELYSQLPDAKVRGYSPRRFSFNVHGGRCEKCEGAGQLKVEMHFLPDVWITCEECGGKRYDRQTLEVKYKGYSIADVLEMSCADAVKLFEKIPPIRRILQTLCDVGLDYLALGQSAPTLSGGEAQRLKLASELARPDTGRTLYLLDEPTTGLHFDDLQKLLDVIHRLVDLGNTAIVIEHNLDMIKNADWIVDLGPEAGAEGGQLVFQGTPEELLEQKGPGKTERGKKSQKKKSTTQQPELRSYTAEVLAPVFQAGPFVERGCFDPAALNQSREDDLALKELGAQTQMPWQIDGRQWHIKGRVSRNGKPVQWNGAILDRIVQRIEESEMFAPTDWDNRSIVEIRAKKKSLGWFFHAITAEEWLLKLKFRTAKNTFRKDSLVSELDLKPLNDVESIPLYGTEPRVRVQRTSGPWQEIELRVHSLEEIDREPFWEFLDLAMRSFYQFTEKTVKTQDELMPWKVLGEKWHFLPKGLVGGQKLLWDYSLLTDIFGILNGIEPECRIVWTNKILVPVFRKGSSVAQNAKRKLPWLVVHTKRIDAVYIDVYVAKNSVPLGQIRNLGTTPFVNGENEDYDIVQLRFARPSELQKGVFKDFLAQTIREK